MAECDFKTPGGSLWSSNDANGEIVDSESGNVVQGYTRLVGAEGTGLTCGLNIYAFDKAFDTGRL